MYLSVGAWALLIYPPIDRQSGWLAPKPFTTTRGTVPSRDHEPTYQWLADNWPNSQAQ